MTTALALRQPITSEIVTMVTQLAPAIHQSQLFGIHSEHQAMAIMLVGHELGFSLTGSFAYVHIIQNKPSVSPQGVLALVMASGELESWTHRTDRATYYTVQMKRRNGLEHVETFTLQDAIAADLVKPGSAWEKWLPNMLKWRCIGFCLDVLFPDLIGGLLRADELGAAVDDDGRVIVEAA